MENSKQMVLPVILKGSNYLLWSRTTKTVLRSRGLWEHVISTKEEEKADGEAGSEKSSKEKAQWVQEDQLVLAVLQSSLDPSILAAYSYSDTAKELWDTLLGVYGNLSNISRIFEVKRALNNLRQETKMFKDIFGDFKGLWAELEMLRPPTTDPKELAERREQDQVFGLLLTLNESFKGLIQHILRYEKLPSLNEVCMMVQKEEGSRNLFQGISESAHVSHGPHHLNEKKNMVCDHCKMKGHMKDKCWTLHPHLKPAKFKNNGQATREFGGGAKGGDDIVRKSDLEALIKSITKLTESGKCLLTSKCLKPIIIDSGASHHMISDAKLLSNVKPHLGKVSIANGHDVMIEGIGNLNILNKKSEALFMPKFTSNLLSVSKTTKDLDCSAVFGSNGMKFQDNKSGNLIGGGKVKDGLYILSEASVGALTDYALSAKVDQSRWHYRFGHPQLRILKLIIPTVSQDEEECEACILGKHSRRMFPESSSCYNDCFDLVHSDVWTAPYPSRDQYKYFISFIDEKSKYTWVTLMKSKSQAFDAFSRFCNYVNTQFGAKIKVLRSDNGGEYVNTQFKNLFEKNGIVHQTTCPYTPQQNGVAERKNRHLMEVSRTMMFARGVPKSYWGDAVMTACYLINRLPTKKLDDRSPYEVLNRTKPSFEHLRVFGCICYVFVPEDIRNKLDAKSMKCMFVGYSSTQKGYKCYSPENKRIYVSRDVKFDEDRGYFNEQRWDDSEKLVSPQSHQMYNLKFVLQGLNELLDKGCKKTGQEETNGGEGHEGENVGEQPHESSDEGNVESDQPVCEGEDIHNEESSVDTEVAITNQEVIEPTLRRSTRVRLPPGHWKNTSVYYNNVAVQPQGQGTTQGMDCLDVNSNVTMECPERTSSFKLVSIGDSIPLSQIRSITSSSYPIESYCSIAHLPVSHQAYLVEIDQERIPSKYEEACTEKKWVKAMEEEMESMQKNGTWELVELPRGKKLVGCRWVFTIKRTSTGAIERYKARLVAKGYTQVYGEDYTETFAPVAKLHSVRVLLSIAVNYSWCLWQMDVKNAFLQGDLEEEVYMELPQGYSDGKDGDKVCKLRKAIYGLKQSPRAWYQRLSTCLIENDFRRSEADYSLFTRHEEQGLVVVLIYVDDIIITGNNLDGINQTKKMLKASFDIKDLGELKYFLGIEMIRSDEGMFISQRKYTLELLSETGKLGARPARTPIEEGYKDEDKSEAWPEIKQYQRLVGKLIYLTITRPDICFAVNQVSKHMQNPTLHHWNMVERIMRYLKLNPGKGIWMKNNHNTDLVGYCDADWAGDRMDRKSTTGYCTFIGGNLVTWRSKKQKVVSLSSAEAEYRAMKDVTKELIWIKYLLKDLGVCCKEPITLYCDNRAAIHIASNPVFHERTKHIELDCHFVREKVEKGIITPSFVRSEDQFADIFTKATTSQVCEYIHSKIGLLDIHKPTLRGSVITNNKSDMKVTNSVTSTGLNGLSLQSNQMEKEKTQIG